eukprot:TRINITY_DN37080_c1_g1_i1.p1 TRINITY_DN37080_c1_g1~~TRINITY_DN37080_c1_g1_i1.p1  ORF type:complete len:1503 (-),score=304.14 TRINITY_DN37080_c1_g1_i1:60-4568(-)
MWVWSSLGYDQVLELPVASLDVLGRRCRLADSAPPEAPAPSPNRVLLEERGFPVEVSSVAGPVSANVRPGTPNSPGGRLGGGGGATSITSELSWRLSMLTWPKSMHGGVRVCVPGTVDVHIGPSPFVLDEDGTVSLFNNTQDALQASVASGGGSFFFKAPMVVVRLREDIASECAEFMAPDDWPLYVAAAVLGAELRVVVSVGRANENSSAFDQSVQDQQLRQPMVLVQCDGFHMSIVQRGGPLIDPARFHGKDEAGVAAEFNRWAGKSLNSRPQTWRTIHINTFRGATEGGGLPSMEETMEFTRDLGPCATTGGGGGGLDVVLAATATAEISLEPFEMSYGDAHVSSLRKMFEDEVADVLRIAPEQVMCGEFVPRRQGAPARRHLRQNSVTLRFSLLHSEVVDVRGHSIATVEFPKTIVPGGKMSSLRGTKTENFGRKDVAALPSKKALQSKTVNLSGSQSLPQLPPSTMGTNSRLAVTPPLNCEDSAGDVQPDLLLRRLIAALNDRKHPMRRHSDCFPMLTRILRGGITSTATLVASPDMIVPGRIAETLKEFMRSQRTKKRDCNVDKETLANLSLKRNDILQFEIGADAEKVAKFREFVFFSPKELLDRLESSFPIPADLSACLDVLIQWSETDKDAIGNSDQCVKLKYNNVIERMAFVVRRFKADRTTMFSCMTIVHNVTKHDLGCVDRILEKSATPEILIGLGNFPKDHAMQTLGTTLLMRLYIRARELAQHGPRVITLGKGVDESWTFRGIDRIVESMSTFVDDQEIQHSGCVTLVSLAELLHNCGKGKMAFERVSVAMKRHGGRADILCLGVTIIARLGPAFLVNDHRGVRVIVEAMGRHRSDVQLQRAGARAFFALSKSEDALKVCRNGGGIGALLHAMCAHSSDPQVLQESTRALEKHCPISLSHIINICGDLSARIPPVYWRADPLDFSGKSFFDISGMRNSGDWDLGIIDRFLGEVLSPKQRKDPALGDDGNPSPSLGDLDSIEGYRRTALRDDIDSQDNLWALPGPPSSGLATREAGQMGEQFLNDVKKLEGKGCDVSSLLVPGPEDVHLRKLCDAFVQGGQLGSRWGAHDGELMAVLMGHFAWHSQKYARKLVSFGVAEGLVIWLRSSHLPSDATRKADTYALQRACLGAMACLCKHGDDCVDAILSAKAAPLVLGLTSHLDSGIRTSAVRCIARMIPHASRREEEDERLPVQEVWDLILREMAPPSATEEMGASETDNAIRTAAAACVLEAVHDGWLSTDQEIPAPLNELAAVIIAVLQRKTPAVDEEPGANSICSLPLLLTTAYLVANEETAAQALHGHEPLLRLLMRWLPVGNPDNATSVDRAAAAGAASTLEALSQRGAALGAEDMESLLRYGSSDSATSGLQSACQRALEPAIQREENIDVLAQLFAVRIPRPGGSERLAQVDVLRSIVERIVQLLRNSPEKMSDRVITALDNAEPFVPKADSEEGYIIRALLTEVRAFGQQDQKNAPPIERGKSNSIISLGAR